MSISESPQPRPDRPYIRAQWFGRDELDAPPVPADHPARPYIDSLIPQPHWQGPAQPAGPFDDLDNFIIQLVDVFSPSSKSSTQVRMKWSALAGKTLGTRVHKSSLPVLRSNLFHPALDRLSNNPARYGWDGWSILYSHDPKKFILNFIAPHHKIVSQPEPDPSSPADLSLVEQTPSHSLLAPHSDSE